VISRISEKGFNGIQLSSDEGVSFEKFPLSDKTRVCKSK